MQFALNPDICQSEVLTFNPDSDTVIDMQVQCKKLSRFMDFAVLYLCSRHSVFGINFLLHFVSSHRLICSIITLTIPLFHSRPKTRLD